MISASIIFWFVVIACLFTSSRDSQHTPRTIGSIPDATDARLDHERLADRLDFSPDFNVNCGAFLYDMLVSLENFEESKIKCCDLHITDTCIFGC